MSRARADLHVGTPAGGSGRFSLPADVVTQTTAILGIRGSGKTNTGTIIVEELLARRLPVVIVDPLDVWWGLKSSANGKAEGYAVVVLGGPHADLPLEEGDGEVIADFAVEQHVPLVLSLRHLRKGAQRRFVTDFAERLYHRKGEAEHRTPLLVVLDEADAFVPQKTTGDVARMVGAIEDLVRRGRSAGLGVMLISQRAASVNKDVLTQLELLVAHRHTSPQDRKALEEWIRAHDTGGHHDAFMASLASLSIGEAWFWSPGWLDVFDRVQVDLRSTFDSSKTPKLGAQAALPDAAAKVDLDALRAQLQTTIEESRANDPKELKRRIAELEKELRQGPKATVATAIERAVETATRELREDNRALQAEVTMVREHAAALADRIHRGRDVAEQLVGMLRNGDGPPATAGFQPESRPPASAPAPPPPRPPHAARVPAPPPVSPPSGDLKGPQQKILDALATYESFGERAPDRAAVAAVAGYKQGGHFNNTVSSLNTAGLIHYPTSGSLALTDEGRVHARGRTFRSLEDLHAAWLDLCSGPQARVLEVVLQAWPDGVARGALAGAIGMREGGHFNNTVSSLRTLGAIDYPAKGEVRASELLFPRGLR